MSEAFQINCPHCHQPITDADFHKDAQSFKFLQDIFQRNEQAYIKKLRGEVSLEMERQHNAIISQKIAETKLEFQKQLAESSKNTEILREQQKTALLMRESEVRSIYEKQATILLEKIAKLDGKLNDVSENNELKLEAALNKQEAAFLKQINAINEEKKNLEIAITQKRTIVSGIQGANLENELEQFLLSMFANDRIEKVTKEINGRKPDYKINVVSDDNVDAGNILIEVKAGEKIDIEKVEVKLAQEMQDHQSKFGFIIWGYAKAPFQRGARPNIFILSPDPNVIGLVFNVLKMALLKENNLNKLIQTGQKDFLSAFKQWFDTKWLNFSASLASDFKKLDDEINKLRQSTEKISEWKRRIMETFSLQVHQELLQLSNSQNPEVK